MSGNLPPGVTASDIDRHYGGGIPDHEHEWVPVQGLSPVLEDMAAIFHEQCHWAEVVNSYTDHRRDETYYETGAECEAERHYRFELTYVELPCGQRLDRDDIDRLEAGGDESMFEAMLDAVIGAERAFPEDTEVVDIDPYPEVGQVVVRHDGYELGYGGEA
ncbi:hypothetical protein [Haloarcula marina]|uniref:hypothetical protein n=1 Tax=Haloarcula marina TaxID=2961574 RepID=UPI0020B69E6B|nr:hypothetical protein [Halomicroarcula marina]